MYYLSYSTKRPYSIRSSKIARIRQMSKRYTPLIIHRLFLNEAHYKSQVFKKQFICSSLFTPPVAHRGQQEANPSHSLEILHISCILHQKKNADSAHTSELCERAEHIKLADRICQFQDQSHQSRLQWLPKY